MSAHARHRAVIVGPGRVGTVFARVLGRAGHRVIAVAGGSDASRRRVVEQVAGVRDIADPVDAVTDDITLVILATPDDAIESVVTAVALADRWRPTHHVVHTAGSRGLAPLDRARLSGARVAACHPAQTFPTDADISSLDGVAWAVTAGRGDRGWASDLVADLGGDPVDVADQHRVLYHAGLVVGSNAVGAAVASARQLLLAAGIDDPGRFLGPLIAASIAGPLERGASAITGPVVRGDIGTVRRHLEVLDRDIPLLAAAYRDLGRVVLAQVRPGLDPQMADDLAAVLRPPTT